MDALSANLFEAIDAVLLADCRRASEEAHGKSDPYLDRVYVRAAIAAIEGIMTTRRAQVASVLQQTPAVADKFSATELKHLRDDKQWKYAGGLAQRVAMALNYYVRPFGGALRFDREDDEGWESFKKGIDVRNRITHPKRAGDLQLSQEDSHHVTAALLWTMAHVHLINSRIAELGGGSQEDLAGHHERMEAIKKDLAEHVYGPGAPGR